MDFLLFSKMVFSKLHNINNFLSEFLNNVSTKLYTFIVFFWHLLFYVLNNFVFKEKLIDPISYYQQAIDINSFYDVISTANIGKGIVFFTYLFTNINEKFELVSLFFSLISFCPFYKIIQLNFNEIKISSTLFEKIAFLFFCFLPSLHMWTTSIYKEALVFPILIYLLIYLQEERKIMYLFSFILLFILLLIRPYLALFVIITFIISQYKRIPKLIIFLLITVCVMIGIYLQHKSQFQSISLLHKNLDNYANQNGKSNLSLSDNNYFVRLIYISFRPFFFDAKNLFQIIYSFENLITLGIFGGSIILFIKKKISIRNEITNIFLVFSLVMLLFYGSYVYNYGLASRMKVMYIPFFIIGILNIKTLKNKIIK